MPKVDLYRCLVISPGEMTGPRGAIQRAIAFWNAHIGAARRIFVEPVLWEVHTRPAMGAHPQTLINQQLLDQCDLGVALFGTRLGTPTSVFPSGSAEEVATLHKRGAPVMVYFSDEPVSPSGISPDQFQKLSAFRQDLEKQALVASFKNDDELEKLLVGHLTNVLDDVLAKSTSQGAVAASSPPPPPLAASAPPAVATAPVSAPLPDLHVVLAASFPMPPHPDPRLGSVLAVVVENHSPSDFFFAGLTFETSGAQFLQPVRDGITGEWLGPKTVRPGDSITYYFSAEVLLLEAEKNGVLITCARVWDKIGREFRSDPKKTISALKNAITILESNGRKISLPLHQKLK